MRQVAEVGELNSPWWHCMRTLMEEGKPLSSLYRIAFTFALERTFPFATLCKTEKNRLIFWPVFEKDLPFPKTDAAQVLWDHITLELGSGKCHPTWYNAKGDRKSPEPSLGWRIQPLQGAPLAHWLSILAPKQLIEQQDLEVQVNVRTPANDERTTD